VIGSIGCQNRVYRGLI